MKKVLRYLTMLPLTFSCILASCRNEEITPERLSDEDAVTVRLNLQTRGVETGESKLMNETDAAHWHINGKLFPQAPAQPRVALMIFNKDLNRYVYSRLLPFNATGIDGEYQVKIRIPQGETDFYALYAPNQTGKDLPYYTPEGSLQHPIPWDFLGTGMEELSMEDISGAAFPALVKEQKDGSLGLPANNPYDGANPAPANEKIVDWTEYPQKPWVESPGLANRLHLSMLSGKVTERVLPSSDKQVQEITVPLFRDFSRIRIYIASASAPDQISYMMEKVAFLNFPLLMSPSFRENDTDKSGLFLSTPGTGKNTEHTGVYSYGVKPTHTDNIYEAPVTADGKIDYAQMETDQGNKYEEKVVPQYLAPYIPEANPWQKKQNHPKIQLTMQYFTGGDKSQIKTRTFLLDVGEESAPGVYAGPIYPNRDYKVFIILPEASDKEIIYRVEPWVKKEVELPPFQ